MRFASIYLLAALPHLQRSLADFQYRSRPDLSPPNLNITIPTTSEVDTGYLFVATYSANRDFKQDASDRPIQPGAYIFRDDGDLVWSSVGYLSGFVANFNFGRWRGQDILYAFQGTIDLLHGHGFGHATILNQHYKQIEVVTGGNHKILDLHEFTIVDERTALVEIYDQVPLDLSPYGGNETQKWIVDALVQELDIETGEVLFEWHSLDHVNPSHSVLPLGSREREGFTSFDAWDYFHINSVDKNADGDYLISGRHVSAIYKLNGKTGDIIWQIGGKHSNFSFGDELEFAFQHDARFRGREENVEYISLFDNGAGSNGHQGGDKGKIRDYSTGKLLKLNTSDWTASIVQEVIHPDRILGASQGNTQILPNGNFFVNWGQAGTITEFRANDSVPIFNAYLDSDLSGDGVQNYRGFRYNWTGQPNEPPAIVALKSDKDEVEIYVSWNGDTETRTWRFYALQGDIKHDLGEQKRRSFETRFVLQKKELSIGRDTRFFAEALGSDGRPLSRTDATSVRPFISSNTNQWYGDNQLFLGEL